MSVTLRYWAVARDAAGCADETVAAGPLGEVLAAAADRHGARLAAVLAMSTLLIDGERVPRDSATVLADGTTVEVLPPFAGG